MPKVTGGAMSIMDDRDGTGSRVEFRKLTRVRISGNVKMDANGVSRFVCACVCAFHVCVYFRFQQVNGGDSNTSFVRWMVGLVLTRIQLCCLMMNNRYYRVALCLIAPET